MLSIPSLQSNIIINYIQNSATDEEIKLFSKTIKEEKKKRENNNKLNALLPLTSNDNILLRDKIVNIELMRILTLIIIQLSEKYIRLNSLMVNLYIYLYVKIMRILINI
ncbi:Hypothetical protein ORPV_865 [Orpheovirus IHUMI-LCC2]|uniref:Uncharacterized protein n=1 Tax=Orpheovirus IHUMI-LCC2 TaxID=2023057 RepID=A0A2I2L5N7_9VIRU|nr:Hypothetical protein ORPV_865 [Orpheovirus IHUMI-LCC2]SNW62769.1 Hypothetical protein ORPV_865 [Orpheovirus IHUMI-LCC2]